MIMSARLNLLLKSKFWGFSFRQFRSLPRSVVKTSSFPRTSATCSTLCQAQVEGAAETAAGVLRRWGCSENHISKLFLRRPSLCKADVALLRSKLNLLSSLGLGPADLVKVVNCRPRFLSCRINNGFNERIEFLSKLFGSRELLHKAIVRNPSFLTYDLQSRMKPVIALYEEMGISGEDLISMLISRPTLIPRTSFDEEKLMYISRTGVSKESKMYKYVVCLIGISHIQTIREKVANLEKFGISDDEVLNLFGRSPMVLTLSVEKVQRNMTFIVGTMKLPPKIVLSYPFLLFINLEAVMKPRIFLAKKIKEMNLSPQIEGPRLLTALKMTENRFVKAFINCHQGDIATDLMGFYKKARAIKRLAEASKKCQYKGFPF